MANTNKKQTIEDTENWINATYELRLADPEPSLLQIVKMAQDLAIPEERRIVVLGKLHADHIIETVKKRFGILAKKEEKEINKIEQLTRRIESIEAALRSKRIKIGLAGLLTNHFQLLEKEFDSVVRFYFIDIDQAKVKVPHHLDYILLSRHMGHRASEAIWDIYPKNKAIWIDGSGLDLFKSHIKELIS